MTRTPVFAVVGSPDLAEVISHKLTRPCQLVTPSTTVDDVSRALKALPESNVGLVTVVNPDAATLAFAGARSGHGDRVVVVNAAAPTARAQLTTPCPVGAVLEALGVPEGWWSEVADWRMADDGTIDEVSGTPQVEPAIVDDPDWGDDPTPAPAPAVPQPVVPAAQPTPQPVVPSVPAPVPVSPSTPVTAPAAAAPAVHVAERPELPRLDLDSLTRRNALDEMTANGQGQVIIPFAGGGGVGKTAFSIALAARAAEVLDADILDESQPNRSSHVVLVDGSRGQADIGKRLRINRACPNVYTAAKSGNPADAIVGPRDIAVLRKKSLEPVKFSVALGPYQGQADREAVTSEVYRQVVAEARRHASLVIIDTQILLNADDSGLFDEVWEPLWMRDAWGLALTDDDPVKLHNLLERFDSMRKLGVDQTRMKSILSRFHETNVLDLDTNRKALGMYSDFVGVVHEDRTNIADAFAVGRIPHQVPEFAEALDRVLFAISGLPDFDPDRPGGPVEQRKQAKATAPSLWARLLGRKG